jgi:hypothetical protein
MLVVGSAEGTNVAFKPTEDYAKTYPSKGQSAQVHVIKIPKEVFGFADVGSYQLTEQLPYLPMVRSCLFGLSSRVRAYVISYSPLS